MTFQFCSQRCLSCDTDSVSVCAADQSGNRRIIRSDRNSVLAVLPSSSTQSQIGRLFSCPIDFTLQPGRNLELIITNLPDSGRIMYIDSVYVGSLLLPAEQPLNFESEIGITMRRDSVPGDDASNVVKRNLNFGFGDLDSLMDTTLTILNSPGNQGAIVFQTRQSLGLSSFDFSGKIIVPPGHSFSVEVGIRLVIGVSDSVVPIGLTVIWYELDV